jgi:sulfur-oxidizing protein SoxX
MGALALTALLVAGCATREPGLVSYRVTGDTIPEALTPTEGKVSRGREIVMSRQAGCYLCHVFPDAGARFMGNVGPPLAGVGARLGASQLRLRIVDASRVNPDTIMPPYYRVRGLRDVAAGLRGKPVLDAQQIEDVVAYLRTLR